MKLISGKIRKSHSKRRYLVGASSGPKVDSDSDRMTEACIKDFLAQAKRGDILLYADKHNFDVTNDIGIMTDCVINDNGEWITEYRLYDERDNISNAQIEKADTLWKQICGIAPYSKPRKRGFSIEGHIPDSSSDVQIDGETRHIDKVHIDGVVVVDTPAYSGSKAYPVMKSGANVIIRELISNLNMLKNHIVARQRGKY